MTLPGTLTTKRVLGRYRVEYPTNDIPGFDYVGHYDDLEQAGRALLDTHGASDVYDTVEKCYIDPLDIPCVEDDYLAWWWSERPWWGRAAHKLGWTDPRLVNWTVGRRALWKRALDLIGIEVV